MANPLRDRIEKLEAVVKALLPSFPTTAQGVEAREFSAQFEEKKEKED